MMQFGILCNSHMLQQWQLEAVSKLIAAGHRCELLIINDNEPETKSFRRKWASYPYSKALVRFWMRYMLKPAAKQEASIDTVLSAIPELRCKTQKRGYAEYFLEADTELVRSHGLDFILRFGFSIIKGDMLMAARYGVWSYHHDDDRKYRGVPTGFWEILYSDPVNAAVLQRLTDSLDSGVILRKGYFKTISHSWTGNLNNLLMSTTEWPLQVCRDIENGVTQMLLQEQKPVSEIYKLPSNLMMARFLWKLLVNKFVFHYRDLFLTEKWNIGFIRRDGRWQLQVGNYDIANPLWLSFSDKRSVYRADPFGFEKDGKLSILCEKYDYAGGKGNIEWLSVDTATGKIAEAATSLEKPYHLAFPFLFEYDGTHYCIPENSAGNSVDLYRFDAETHTLIFVSTLIANLQAVDPVLHFHEGRWWLFFTDKASTNERLHIWVADSITGPFSPHKNNPVKTDVRSARPAGNLFENEGSLYRPAQDCSTRSGARVRINRVVTLSETEFAEQEAAVINPGRQPGYRQGMHTYCTTPNFIVIDGKTETFVSQAFINKLFSKLLRLIKR